MINLKKIFLYNFLILFILVILLECFFYLKVKNNSSIYKSHYDFRKLQPEPYEDATYFSNDFLEEWKKHPGGYSQILNTNIIIPNNFQGKYINVKENLRATTSQPLNSLNTVHVFGGSSIFSGEVPDKNTIPSFLQVKLNNADRRYIVKNYGVSSIIAKQQYERMKKTVQIKKGDIVIFYDGANDILQKIYFNNQDGWILGGGDNKEFYWIKILRKIAKYSYSISYIDKKITQALPLKANFKNEAQIYLKEIKDAEVYVKNKGGKFYHFLQPVLFEKENKNRYEKELLLIRSLVPIGLEEVFKKGYPEFKKQLKKLSNSYDLTKSFDVTKKSPYLDWCHINHEGNEIIANKIFDIIIKDI